MAYGIQGRFVCSVTAAADLSTRSWWTPVAWQIGGAAAGQSTAIAVMVVVGGGVHSFGFTEFFSFSSSHVIRVIDRRTVGVSGSSARDGRADWPTVGRRLYAPLRPSWSSPFTDWTKLLPFLPSSAGDRELSRRRGRPAVSLTLEDQAHLRDNRYSAVRPTSATIGLPVALEAVLL